MTIETITVEEFDAAFGVEPQGVAESAADGVTFINGRRQQSAAEQAAAAAQKGEATVEEFDAEFGPSHGAATISEADHA